MVITIRAWALKPNSYPDLYVNVNKPDCTTLTADWKSNQIGDNEIKIMPADKKYQAGLYRCAIEAFRGEEEHFFGIEVKLKEAKPVNEL